MYEVVGRSKKTRALQRSLELRELKLRCMDRGQCGGFVTGRKAIWKYKMRPIIFSREENKNLTNLTATAATGRKNINNVYIYIYNLERKDAKFL